MKSKKIVALIVAFAAFMAVATSGLAAVTTTTTYNEIADKVVINVDVTEATGGSEVTYLVKSNNDIVYIDQKTADTDGKVEFDYKIAKNKITNLTTDVQFGTNGAAAITGGAIELNEIDVAVENATVTFYKDADCENAITGDVTVGNNDEIFAKVAVADGYEIVTVEGLEETATANVYKVVANAVVVTTKVAYVAPGVQEPEQEELKEIISEDVEVEVGGEKVAAKQYTKVIKVVGQPTEVGVKYAGEEYPALTIDNAAYDATKLYAVRIIVGTEVVVDGLAPYVK